MPYPVSKARFADLVQSAIAELPEPFARLLEEIPIEIEDHPSQRLLRELGLQSNELLLGLYQGRPLNERSVEDSGRLPDRIVIFQKDIEEVCDSDSDLIRQVRITVLHEIGHFFGMDEDDLDQLGYG
ncbi:MAG TPA: metallopeptidase family protein [Tepidisphaeraceae bacterium]|nr:metallopeptidase family protein [Tepidisphaeraceae bacterium]